MYQNPVTQLHLARELDRFAAQQTQIQIDPQPRESVLDAIVRRLRQLINTKPMKPLTRGTS